MVDERPHVFIAHAHEDKEAIVAPLVIELKRRGLRVWYDEFSLQAGDSIMESIQRGIREAEYGVVVFSPTFFTKGWALTELKSFMQRQLKEGKSLIRPIYYKMTVNEVLEKFPMLADVKGISTESLSIPLVVDRLLASFSLSRELNANELIAPSGITTLDRMLGGGFPRRTSIVLTGPVGIGKTTLGLQVQIASLERGEPCLYITYREHPVDIIRQIESMGAPVQDYIDKGKFAILDNFSALNQISESETRDNVIPEWRKCIHYVRNPHDVDSYYEIQVALMEQMGLGGVNVIDSTNERHEMLKAVEKLPQKQSQYFRRFKARLAALGGQSAIHIATETHDMSLADTLEKIQDGVIRMEYTGSEDHRRRRLRIEKFRGRPHDEGWHEFIIIKTGLEIF